tara:strand:+ start:143 stop:922 length:780 start_codon:yes stop_codon:yes gene_type:complete
MENYIDNFKNFTKTSVYDFKLGNGGIGDYLKFYMIILTKCMRKNIKFYHKINNIDIEKYIKLKYDFLYISSEEISKLKNVTIEKPCHYYNNDEYDGNIHLNEIFYFDDIVKTNVKNILSPLPINYISIHLRLGDKFLETDKKYVCCKDDRRNFSSENLYKFIEDNNDKNIIFFCDNNSEKLKVKNKYNNIIITTSQIGHTSLSNTTNKQILDSITDFYILSNSQLIYSASYSGFSKMASKFNNIKLISKYSRRFKCSKV